MKLYAIWEVKTKRYKYSIPATTYFDSKEKADRFIQTHKAIWPDWIISETPHYTGSFKKENAEKLLGYQIEE